jgi:hypothetical protein
MSVSVQAYLVDLHDLQAIHGSKDTKLLQELEAAFRDDIETTETPEEIIGRDPNGVDGTLEVEHPTLREALHGIVAGTIPTEEGASRYAWALELICQHIGTPLANEPFLGFRGVDTLLQVDRLGDLVDRWHPPIPIPNPYDVSGITFLSCEEARTALARLPEVPLTMPFELDPECADENIIEVWREEWIKRMQVQYRSWLEEAVHTGKDIVVFLG